MFHVIRSFTPDISIAPLQVHYYSEAPRRSADIVLESHAEAPQATASEGLVQGPYVEARAGFEPVTFRTKGIESTNESLSLYAMSCYVRLCSVILCYVVPYHVMLLSHVILFSC